MIYHSISNAPKGITVDNFYLNSINLFKFRENKCCKYKLKIINGDFLTCFNADLGDI